MALAESRDLKGLRLLVVEDDALIALFIEDLVASFGCVLAGKASTVNEALKLIETVPIDGALVDVNLGGVFKSMRAVLPHMIARDLVASSPPRRSSAARALRASGTTWRRSGASSGS